MLAPFQFKQFAVKQDKCAFKVGTDGVLLGAWTDCKNTKTVLDIGTGTGLIALMLAQRCVATIHAVEIDKESAKQAKENFLHSKWQERLTVFNSKIQDFAPTCKYDLIASNPPFFNNSLLPKTKSLAKARHTSALPYSTIIKFTTNNLNAEGKLAVILPVEEAAMFIEEAEKNSLYLNKCTKVLPIPTKLPKRYLMEFSFHKQRLKEDKLVIEESGRHQYSEDYINLTKDFYLKM